MQRWTVPFMYFAKGLAIHCRDQHSLLFGTLCFLSLLSVVHEATWQRFEGYLPSGVPQSLPEPCVRPSALGCQLLPAEKLPAGCLCALCKQGACHWLWQRVIQHPCHSGWGHLGAVKAGECCCVTRSQKPLILHSAAECLMMDACSAV